MSYNIQEEARITAWKERVHIETVEHIIEGFVFMPKIGKKARLLSEILNSEKKFVAVTDCTLEYKLNSAKEIEHHKFMQVNLSTILIIRPLDND